jgi:hypothetical protein
MLTCGVDYEFFSDFTGSTTEKGIDNGVNTNINYPLPRGTQDSDYCATLSNAVQDIKRFDPGYLLLRFLSFSVAGFNADHTLSVWVSTPSLMILSAISSCPTPVILRLAKLSQT